ncbi:MAG: hypothetical protein LBM09_00870 [Candidatus Nomurabacteria bacterium]|jgi:arginine deiminase|nr:hypothetical protein [Candidatus Nomurabacteria bacterium]
MSVKEIDLNIQNEYAPLKSVYMSDRQNPDHQGFIGQLKSLGVDVILANKTQLSGIHWPFLRDPFMVVDDTFVLGGIDRGADNGITTRPPDILSTAGNIYDLIHDNKFTWYAEAVRDKQNIPVILEGGDVIVHNGTIFVGQGGQFTNKYGLRLMQEQWDKKFGNKFNVQPIYMQPEAQVTHLDCVFNPISEDTAIVHFDPIMPASRALIKKYFERLITLKRSEYAALAANVFSVGDKQVFVEKRQERLIKELTKNSFKPIPTKFSIPISSGGSFRCATMPLIREKE